MFLCLHAGAYEPNQKKGEAGSGRIRQGRSGRRMNKFNSEFRRIEGRGKGTTIQRQSIALNFQLFSIALHVLIPTSRSKHLILIWLSI